MTHTKQLRTLAFTLTLAVLAMAAATRVEAQTTFFADTFDRADNTILDAATNGMSGLLISSGAMTAGAGNIWVTPDDNSLNTNDTLITVNTLKMGGNAHTVQLFNNFNYANLVSNGTVSVSVDLKGIPTGSPGGVERYIGLGIGFSYAEGNTVADRRLNNIADLFVDESMDGQIRVYDGAASNRVVNTPDATVDLNLGATTFIPGTLRVDLTITNTAVGSKVTYNVLFNASPVVSGRSFVWSGNNEFYVGMEERSGAAVTNDNFTISANPYTPPPLSSLVWRAQTDNNWNTTTTNWVDAGSGANSYAFFTGANVSFDDRAANPSVNLPGAVQPGNMFFNNSSTIYTLTGAGSIGGSGNLTKAGTNILTLSQGNSFSGGTTVNSGWLRVGNDNALGSGVVTLSGGTISSVGSTAHTLANSVLIPSASTVGDVTDNGTLTFNGLLDFGGGGRTLTVNGNSTVVFAGGSTNGLFGGKQGIGTLVMKGVVAGTNFSITEDVFNGTLVYDGATVTTQGRVISDAATNSVARLVITNGASVVSSSSNGNLRAGRASAGGGTNYTDLAGFYSLPNAVLPDGNATMWGGALYSEITFWPGADFTANAVLNSAGAGVGNTVFKFAGGMLRARQSTATFFEGLSQALVLAGGANIDSDVYSITINQALLSGGGNGGLTKYGSGTLILNGANTYTGPTIVSNGMLTLSPSSLPSGAVVVADNAKLSVTNTGSPLVLSSLTQGATGTSTLQFNFPSGIPAGQTITATSLTAKGPVLVNITGTGLTVGSFPLVQFTSVTGLANFQLGMVQPGIYARLVTNATSISLNITNAVKSLEWQGLVDLNWNTSTVNWYDLNTALATNFTQPGGLGDVVAFDGYSSGSTINLALPVTPLGMTVKSGAFYTFSGPGKISGIGGLTINDYSAVQFGTVNDFSGGTLINAGYVFVAADQALGSGPVTISAGQLRSDGATARTLTNVFTLTADTGVYFGDSAYPGRLTLGGLNLSGGTARTLDIRSDVALTGALTNGAFTTKQGAGALIIKANSQQSALVNHMAGNMVVDGAQFDNANGWRLANTDAGNPLHLVVTNGGIFTITTTSANLKIGQSGITGSDGSAVNIVDVAGTINMTPVGAVGANTAVILGQIGSLAVLNTYPGGNLITRAVVGSNSASSNTVTEAHFRGGTLTAIANEPAFIQGLTNAFMETGGLTIDTTNFTVTVPQALLASGSGGLTKLGVGTLNLTGSNTYSGNTLVNAGKLVLVEAHAATGGIIVSSNATLTFLQTTPSNRVTVASVTIGSGANSTLEAQLIVTNAPAGVITSLSLNGTVAVNAVGPFTGGQIPLFGYGTISGSGHLVTGVLPQGTVAHLVTNVPNKTIDLVVDGAAPTTWTGVINGNWDTNTTNWTSLGLPVAYQQPANVLFNDSASNATVNLTVANLQPASISASNSLLSYAFAGAGTLTGGMSLTKNGTNGLAIYTANSYTGTTTVKAGTLVAGNATAFGATNGAVVVQTGGTLDVNDNNLGYKPVIVGGTGAGGLGALINSGAGGNNNALLDVTLTADTTIRADSQLGIRMPNDTDPGFHGNGHKLVKLGVGTLALNGGQANTTNPFVWDCDLGDADVQQGTLSFQRRMTMGRATNTITVQSGAVLEFFALNPFVLPLQVKPVVLNNGALSGTGGVGTDTNSFGGPIALASGTNYIRAQQGTTFQLYGPITGSGDNYANSGAAATVALFATNTYAGKTVIQSGIVSLRGNGSISNSSGVWISSGAQFDVSAVSPWTLKATQTLGGSGTNVGSVLANGTLAPGDAVGTLTISSNLTLAGNILMEVNKALAQSNDVIAVAGTLSNIGSGTVTVTNVGATALVVGDKFTLFSKPVAGGAALTVTGAGATWTNNLAVDGSISALTVTLGIATNAISMTNSYSGGNLHLSWPTDHIGWHLEAQTNTLATGLRNTNWFPWPNSSTTNSVSIPVNSTNPSVFFRLVSP